MARMGALTKTPPLRGQARKDFQAGVQGATQAASQVQRTGNPQQILHGQARKDYQAAAQAALAAGEAPPSQQQYMPKIQPRSIVNAVSGQRNFGRPVGQGLAGAVGSGAPIGNQIGMLQPGQSPADVAGAVAGGIAAQPQQGAWWQGQQQYGPPPGSLPMTKPGMPPMPQMPQPSANHGGQYRLSPGVYGTQQQAMEQYNQQMRQPAMPMFRKY